MTHNRLMLTYAQARGPPTATTCAATRLRCARPRLVSVIARARAGIRFNEHMEHDDGETVFRHACKLGLEGDRVEAEGFQLPIRPLIRLAQDEESRLRRGEAGGGGGLGQWAMVMTETHDE